LIALFNILEKADVPLPSQREEVEIKGAFGGGVTLELPLSG